MVRSKLSPYVESRVDKREKTLSEAVSVVGWWWKDPLIMRKQALDEALEAPMCLWKEMWMIDRSWKVGGYETVLYATNRTSHYY